jgi:3-oxoacyl-[acyl-carrier protein] reductase
MPDREKGKTMTQPRIQARTAIVFGGSRGIGAAIAQRLAADGANVVLTYVSAPDKATEAVAAIEQHGGTALAIRADSANANELKHAVEQAVECFGQLDIVVVNAGILHISDIATFDINMLDRMLVVNVRGVFIAIQAALAHMREGGRVVTIGSNTAVRLPGFQRLFDDQGSGRGHGQRSGSGSCASRHHDQQRSARPD